MGFVWIAGPIFCMVIVFVLDNESSVSLETKNKENEVTVRFYHCMSVSNESNCNISIAPRN